MKGSCAGARQPQACRSAVDLRGPPSESDRSRKAMVAAVEGAFEVDYEEDEEDEDADEDKAAEEDWPDEPMDGLCSAETHEAARLANILTAETPLPRGLTPELRGALEALHFISQETTGLESFPKETVLQTVMLAQWTIYKLQYVEMQFQQKVLGLVKRCSCSESGTTEPPGLQEPWEQKAHTAEMLEAVSADRHKNCTDLPVPNFEAAWPELPANPLLLGERTPACPALAATTAAAAAVAAVAATGKRLGPRPALLGLVAAAVEALASAGAGPMEPSCSSASSDEAATSDAAENAAAADSEKDRTPKAASTTAELPATLLLTDASAIAEEPATPRDFSAISKAAHVRATGLPAPSVAPLTAEASHPQATAAADGAGRCGSKRAPLRANEMLQPLRELLGQHQKALRPERRGPIFIVQQIYRLGHRYREALKQHFMDFGEVSRILVPQVKTTREHTDTQQPSYPGGLGLVIMRSSEHVSHVLAQGREQVIAGQVVRVERFDVP